MCVYEYMYVCMLICVQTYMLGTGQDATRQPLWYAGLSQVQSCRHEDRAERNPSEGF